MRFSTMIMLAYAIPNIYLFFRIWILFISKKQSLAYVLVYIGIVSIFPLNDVIEYAPVRHCLDVVSTYLLPFYLYLFLFTLAFDIFLLCNLLIKVLSKDRMKSPQFRKYALLSLISASVIVVVGGVINFNTIRVSEYTIETPARSSKAENLKIAFIADFHIDTDTPESFIRRFVTKTNSLAPDIVLFGGDIAEGRNSHNLQSKADILKQISSKYGAFGVLGNHDRYRGQEEDNFFNKSQIELLRDTVVVIRNEFCLAGRLDGGSDDRKTVEELLENVVDTLPLIMLDHRPTEFDEVIASKTNIRLSGHTHHGQMFPINLILNRMYVLSYGRRKIENTHFFVTSGIRLWRYPVRTVGKSEIMLINVNFVE